MIWDMLEDSMRRRLVRRMTFAVYMSRLCIQDSVDPTLEAYQHHSFLSAALLVRFPRVHG